MRKLWHWNNTQPSRIRFFEPFTTATALAALTAGAGTAGVGAGLWGMFGAKKKKKDVD